MGDEAQSPSQSKRQRAKQACEPCRLRKRRCDGSLPCNMCTQFEYKCYFEKHPRKRSKIVEQSAQANGTEDLLRAGGEVVRNGNGEQQADLRSMEANSGIAFTRLLGLKLDPSSGLKLFTFGWNLGPKHLYGGSSFLSSVPRITDLLTYEQYQSLATLYFDNVHPLYGFLDKPLLEDQAKVRWTRPNECVVPDHLFAGIAALSTLFSDGSFSSVVPQLAELQKLILENTSMMQPCTLMDVQSWAVRSLYLRGTDHPHATHMCTCITMHLAEAIGLHQEESNTTLHDSSLDSQTDAEVRRRVFWVSRMLNTWVSFEYGRTRVTLSGINIGLPSPRDGDYTADYIELYSISCCLDPDKSDQSGQWENFLRRLEAYQPKHECITLSKANLAMCGYRRLRLANPNLSSDTANRIIRMGLMGLAAARGMADKGLAWWHVANVPFQVVCVFLAMDVRESLAHIGTAIELLDYVAQRFGTVTSLEALKTARFLVRLSKKRKDEDAEVLGQSLISSKSNGSREIAPYSENFSFQATTPAVTGNYSIPSITSDTPSTMVSNGDDWNLDALAASQFDWNFLLDAAIPALPDFTPDATM